MLWASQVSPGHENGLKIRVYGTKGGLEWVQAEPNRMVWSPLGANQQIVTRNGPGADAANRRMSRVPAGHPEGYLEGFANLYAEIAEAIVAARDAERLLPATCSTRPSTTACGAWPSSRRRSGRRAKAACGRRSECW